MIKYNGYVIGKEGFWLKAAEPPLPPFTIRLKLKEGAIPSSRGTAVQVSSSPNIWDLTYENPDWNYLCGGMSSNLIEVIGANTTGVTNMGNMFQSCGSLKSIALFDTSNVTEMLGMFTNCEALTSIPLFDTSKVIQMSFMFANCFAVQSGALALYRQASTQAVPPSDHLRTFTNCGANTQTGAAELAQIPEDWK